MRTLTEQLSKYAGYHRDRRNLTTHLVGIPMIVAGVATLLARPAVPVGALAVSPAVVAGLAAAIFYLRLDVRFGLVMSAVLAAIVTLGQRFGALDTAAWLGWGVRLFVVGWAFQFVGHFWEGRKPAFVDDLAGLIVGPLFVAAELAFMLGWRLPLQRAIEKDVGPMRGGHLPRGSHPIRPE